MSLRIVKSGLARSDLREQAEFLRQSNPRAALRFLAEAEATFRRLAAMPGLGESYETSIPNTKGLRCSRISGFPSHLVFYQSTDREIIVVRVLHGARDLGPIFGGADDSND
jgi:toxin ParE1/3/4